MLYHGYFDYFSDSVQRQKQFCEKFRKTAKLTCLLPRALKSLAEKEELDMDRVRLPKDADTERVKDGWEGVGEGVFAVVFVEEEEDPRREEEEPWRLRLVAGSYMDLVSRLTEEVWVRDRFFTRLDSIRSELVRCI